MHVVRSCTDIVNILVIKRCFVAGISKTACSCCVIFICRTRIMPLMVEGACMLLRKFVLEGLKCYHTKVHVEIKDNITVVNYKV